ncbi:MAG: hypothetical protein KDA24_11690 [Deltaproteobacteria bacterium]|nr:hypothetical protein [Deltaproteobacteria bacterium]
MTTIEAQIKLAACLGALTERVSTDQLSANDFLHGLVRHLGGSGAVLSLRLADDMPAVWTWGLDDDRARRLFGGRHEPAALEGLDLPPVARLADLVDEEPSLVELEEAFMNRLGVEHVLRVSCERCAIYVCRFGGQREFENSVKTVIESLQSLFGIALSQLARSQSSRSAVLDSLDEPSFTMEEIAPVHASCPVPLVLIDQDVRVLSANPAAHRKLDLAGDPPTLPPWLAENVGDRLRELRTEGGIPDGVSGDYQFVQPVGRRVMRLGLVPLETDNGASKWLVSVEHGGPLLEERLAEIARLYGLKDREVEVLELLVEGLKNSTIARSLELTEATVKYRLGRVMEKTETENRTELLATVFSLLPARARS